MTEEQMQRFQPDVFGTMEAKLARNRKSLQEFSEQKKRDAKATILRASSTDKSLFEKLNTKFDLVVTSPPYGDSRTTVAYGQFSRLSNQWLDFEDVNQLDNLLLGGKPNKEQPSFESESLNQPLSQIRERDDKRASDVAAFYADYYQSIANVAGVVKAKGFVAYVVGNRKVKGITLPNDEVTAEFFIRHGFAHVETVIRNIPNKRMPSKNSPTNISGAKDETMTKEYIVILQNN